VGKTLEWEGWPVGVTAHHLGTAHFSLADLLNRIIAGDALPQLTMDQINAGAKAGARKHLYCSKAETLELLQNKGAKLSALVAGLSDDDLNRKGSMPAFGGQVSAEQLIEYILFRSAGRHLESMKAAIGM
jgi:DinB superfamily